MIIEFQTDGECPTEDISKAGYEFPSILRVGDEIEHLNENMHLTYTVTKVRFVIDECVSDGQSPKIYQLVAVTSKEWQSSL